MIRTPLPTLRHDYVYSIQSVTGFPGYKLCIHERDSGTRYQYFDTPLASVVLAEYPGDFEQEIWEAITALANEYWEYFTDSLPDPRPFYTQALYSTVSEDEIR